MRIGELASKVGVSTHVLRAWESRYGLLRPQRSAGGYRLYGHEDERRVREVIALRDQGVSAAEASRRVLEADRSGLSAIDDDIDDDATTTTVEGRNAVMELSDALPDVYGEVEQMLLKFRACPYENVVREAVKTAMATFKAGVEKMKAEAPVAPAQEPAAETVSA